MDKDKLVIVNVKLPEKQVLLLLPKNATALFAKQSAITYCGRPPLSNLANNIWASESPDLAWRPTQKSLLVKVEGGLGEGRWWVGGGFWRI